MKHNTPTRRQFLATAACGILIPESSGLAATNGVGRTDHFLYRLSPPDGPYIDTQRDNKAFAFGDREVLLSEDNAKTWAYSADFADAQNIMFSSILGNGNIVFATLTKIYLSTDNLKTCFLSSRYPEARQRNNGVYSPVAARNSCATVR